MAINHKKYTKVPRKPHPKLILDRPADRDKQMVLAFSSSTKTSKEKKRQAFEMERLYLSQKNNNSFSLSALRPFVSTGSRIKSSIARNSSGILVVVCLIAIVLGWFFVDLWVSSPSLNKLANNPPESSILYAKDGKTKIYEYFKEEKREFISIDKVPRNMQLAVIALEDENFYINESVPWKNLIGAIQKCITSLGDNCRGGSGIAQQLVKVMTKQNQSSLDRKARELVTAIKLNQEKTHTDILEAYLNWVPFGRNSYGVQQASRNYFGKDINEFKNEKSTLSDSEACFLASLIQSPSYYEESINNPTSEAFRRLVNRKNACLDKLAELQLPLDDNGNLGILIKNPEDLANLKSIPIQKAKDIVEKTAIIDNGGIAIVKSSIDDPFPHFREYVTQELTKILGDDQLASGGYRIITTLDPAIQIKTQEIIQKYRPNLQAINANNAASVILDGKTGQIVSMVGSVDYNDDAIDGKVNILTTPQQPGSSIKPYVYANAWDNGYSPATSLNDVYTTWNGDYSPKNFSGRFNGAVSMRYALQNSLNIPAVKALLLGAKSDKSNDGFVAESNLDLAKTLTGFFNFTTNTGLKFPCQESGDGFDTCNNSALASQAYHKRCFLSTALGGCEVDPLSHTTGINTLLHEGNLTTATPFISIFQNSGGKTVDICESLCPKFYPKKEKAVDPLVSKQVANVMTDYDVRAAEYGQARFNLELDDKRWRVAAKTGTSNGPKDFWVVGGSPVYTVTIWGGRTDNGDMNGDASASIAISKLWKDHMELVHKGLEPVNFSTEGLVKKDISKGKTEFLTPEQVNQFKEKTKLVN